ncbi:phosphotransferase family protein [Texcoconibacillus texcoconensis]|uniref:Thiamine kinase-like enzyme n=1 Tax=Texcoconibacillus texcoconensis TaxID=1095777 RepID=A0A840QN48_9BACI|nr:phosphotransferase family protein [Texcoconibacillus texcoconensis]MBB5172796.1 thiamine kinase-like enzyme [Texcoconibacillus texcoconensis]
MKHFLGEGWQLHPAGGATGEAYIAQQGDQKLFIKRNSSPFLAVLSAEGIVPKLLWTKRLENGDVITAQRWINGRRLEQSEMNQTAVAQLLSTIHRSTELLEMFKRMGNKPLTPFSILKGLEMVLAEQDVQNDHIDDAMMLLYKYANRVESNEMVVCHCDVNHNNWMVSHDGSLYLIDWDGAMVADPAFDISLLLYSYIPRSDWEKWLEAYGIAFTKDLYQRMLWYMISQSVEAIIWHTEREAYSEVIRWTNGLQSLITETKEQFEGAQN